MILVYLGALVFRFYAIGGNHRAAARRQMIEHHLKQGPLPDKLTPLLTTQAQIVINPNKQEAKTVILSVLSDRLVL